jgi:hypothetical protein
VGKKDKPRERVTGPNGIANGEFGFQGVTVGGKSEDEGHGERCHRRRQLVGGGDLRDEGRNESDQVPSRCQ